MANYSALYNNICTYDFSNPYTARLWSRFKPADYDHAILTPAQLDERRKCEILKYKKNSSQMTKKEQYAAAARGTLLPKRGFAMQTDTITNPNVANLPMVGNSFVCPSPTQKCSLTTDCDVPGPAISLCYNPEIPLYNYVRTYEYKAGEILRSQIPTTALTAPNNLIITGGNKKLTASWSIPDTDIYGTFGGADLAGYRIAYSSDRNNWTYIPKATNGYVGSAITSYDISGSDIVNNAAYYVKVDSVNAAVPKKLSAFPAISSATTFLVPSKPQNFVATGDDAAATVADNKDKTNIIVTWSAPSSNGGTEITGYMVQYSSDYIVWNTKLVNVAQMTDVTLDSVTGLYSYRFTGTKDDPLITKSLYYVRISAINLVVSEDGIPAPFSSIVAVNTLNVPGPVTNVNYSAGTQRGQIILSWSPPKSNGGGAIQLYSITYYLTTDETRTIRVGGTTTDTNFTLSGLLSDNQYYTVFITAENSTYTSEPYTISARANTVPGRPIGLKAVVNNGSIILSFVMDDNGGSNIASYAISISTDATNWVEYEFASLSVASIGSVILNLTTSLLTNGNPINVNSVILPKTLYYFRAAAKNVLYYDSYGPYTSSTVTAKIIISPNPITDIQIAIGETVVVAPAIPAITLTLRWGWGSAGVDDNIGGDTISNVGYIIQYSTTIGSFKVWISYNNESNLIKKNTITLSTGIKPDTSYFFRIYTVNSIGTSVASEIFSIRTPQQL